MPRTSPALLTVAIIGLWAAAVPLVQSGDAAQVAVQESLRPRDLLKFDFFVPGRAEFTAGPWRGVSNLTDRATIRRTLQELVSSGVLSSYRAGTEAIGGEEAQQHLVAERRTVLCTPWWMPISA